MRSDTRYHPECKRRKNRHKSRTVHRRNGDRYFIGIDGELGLNEQGEEVYQLLGCGNDDFYGWAYRKSGLTWEDVFEFLWRQFECHHGERDVFVGFFLRFDFSQWFKGWPEAKARLLFTKAGMASRKTSNGITTVPVKIRGEHSTWYVNGIGERMIRIQKKGSKLQRYMAINDAGPFFQTSLVNAIDPKGWKDPICTREEFDEICKGKADRASIGNSLEERSYNSLENSVLCRMLGRYNQGLSAMGIHLGIHQWYGPGQAAQEWFKNIGLPDRETNAAALGKYWDVCIESYIAGWFETFVHGRIKGVTYEYDINSAYPTIMAQLPCILHGTWREGTGIPPTNKTAYTLIRGRVIGSNPRIGAMLHRVSTSHSIARPRITAGVYWQHEIEAAKRAGALDDVEIERWYQFTPECNCPPPLLGVADLYTERLRVGKSTAAGKSFKLIYNSGYGKVTQSVGAAKFANPMFASLITAGCRVKILDAIATHPDGVDSLAMVATDAVFFMDEHPGLSLSDKLGDWGMEEKHDLTIFKPGHYWDEKVRKDLAAGKKAVFKARGVNARDFSSVIEKADAKFLFLIFAMRNRPYETNPVPHKLWPNVTYQSSFSVVTIGQALSRNDWESCGRISHDTTIGPIDSDPFRKRDAEWCYYDPARKIVRTNSYELAWNGKNFETENTPYDRRFGMEREEQWSDADVITPDGDMGTLIQNTMGQGK